MKELDFQDVENGKLEVGTIREDFLYQFNAISTKDSIGLAFGRHRLIAFSVWENSERILIPYSSFESINIDNLEPFYSKLISIEFREDFMGNSIKAMKALRATKTRIFFKDMKDCSIFYTVSKSDGVEFVFEQKCFKMAIKEVYEDANKTKQELKGNTSQTNSFFPNSNVFSAISGHQQTHNDEISGIEKLLDKMDDGRRVKVREEREDNVNNQLSFGQPNVFNSNLHLSNPFNINRLSKPQNQQSALDTTKSKQRNQEEEWDNN